MKRAVILCMAILFMAANLWADTVTFKSGKKVDGNIKSITNDAVTVEIFGVTEMTYDLAEIQEINGQLVELKPAAAPALSPAAACAEAPATEEEIRETPEEGPAVESDPVIPNIDFSQKQQVMLGAGVTVMFLIVMGVLLLICLAFYVFLSICLQLIAKKTGNGPAWLAWIPIANLFLTCKIAGLSYLWLLALFIPLVDIFVIIYMWYKVSEARGKPGLLALLLLVPVANLVFMGYLAFSGPASPCHQDHAHRPPLE